MEEKTRGMCDCCKKRPIGEGEVLLCDDCVQNAPECPEHDGQIMDWDPENGGFWRCGVCDEEWEEEHGY